MIKIIKFESFGTHPKNCGGLGVVDSQIKASALYFRWLQPLLAHDQSVIDSHPHPIPLLFPSSRSRELKKQRTGTVDMLHRAIDYLPRSFDDARINTATAMVLPLQTAFYIPPSSIISVPITFHNAMGFRFLLLSSLFVRPDSASYILFNCPSKEKVWQGAIFEFLWPTTSIIDVKKALLSLNFSSIWYCQHKGIQPYRILLIALSKIWLAHMRFIFDKTLIISTAILANIRSNAHQAIAEDQCHSLL
ncbi:hypothetical protein INT46_011067 [Mucor plumbeus]|uniref:Uncharacterized protein n=1 Tax=Mucor plumbeus TaxID=97098 RepID=A0A8H7UZ25_9FUNG|nr:hypothetical protein INT46_011067 [Mucor plumbeus]